MMRLSALLLLMVVAATRSAVAVEYYINDTATNRDAWCTAPGVDANTGLSPASPKATLQSLLAAYDLEPGDTVRIDTGTYELTNDVTVAADDGGSVGAPVIFEASPYGVVIDRKRANWDTSMGWAIHGDYVVLRTAVLPGGLSGGERWMEVTDAYAGVFVFASHCAVSRLQVHHCSNGVIVNSADNSTANCVFRENDTGFRRSMGDDVSVENCTFFENTTVGAHMFSMGMTNVTFRNNIVCARGIGVLALRGSPNVSDHNLFHLLDGANLAGGGVVVYDTLAVWRHATGLDAHSLSLDPRFLDPTNHDFHPRSTGGVCMDGLWSNSVVDSPCVDTGIGTSDDEPAPNTTAGHPSGWGSRNMGTFGGTWQASKTPGYRRVWLLEPIGHETYIEPSSPVSIRWTWSGQAWNGTETVGIAYSSDSGATWQPVTGAASVSVTQGAYSWDTHLLPAGPLYRVRLVCNDDSAVRAESGADFRIGSGTTFYVNDTSVVNDAWCTAPGNDANTGLLPSTPKRTVQAVLDRYDLEPGDRVLLDTGQYAPNADITVGDFDSGSSAHPVVFEASPYGVRFDRGNPAWTTIAWHLLGSNLIFRTASDTQYPAVPQRWARVTGAGTGVKIDGVGCTLSRIDVHDNNPTAINISSEDAVVEHCLARGAVDPHQGYGIYVEGFDAVISNCTVYGNGRYGMLFVDRRRTRVRDTLICADGGGRYCFYGVPGDSDYNGIVVSGGAAVRELPSQNVLANLAEWRAATGQDTNSLALDPGFVNPSGGDFHLRSTAGIYRDGGWSNDVFNSPYIDAGIGAVGAETTPNASPWHGAGLGQRNVGAYGGTEQASRTPLNRRLLLLEPLGGEIYSNQLVAVDIRWTWSGTAWQAGDTVRLRYSSDGGGSWSELPGASAVPASAGRFAWDVAALPRGPLYRVEITCNQSLPSAAVSSSTFRVGEAVIYYVNDASLSNDVWCTAAGDDALSGLLPSEPKASIQAVLDAYNLEPGDSVRIDTGLYSLAAGIEMDVSDGGSDGAPVVFEGSPYGVVLSYADTGWLHAVWRATDHVEVRTALDGSHPGLAQSWMCLRDASVGLYGGSARRLDCRRNAQYGIWAGPGVTIAHCLTDNIYSDQSDVTISNCTVFGSVKVSWDNNRLVNSIVVADGPGIFALRGIPSVSDYNTIWVTNGAYVGRDSVTLNTWPTLGGWRQATGRDSNSLAAAPCFVDLLSGDAHLQSTRGAYSGGTWIPSAKTSPCIDAGLGVAGDEPVPNAAALHADLVGQRNHGAYGGTPLASKTAAVRGLVLIEPAGGEVYVDPRSPIAIRWLWTGTAWLAGDTVSVAYSSDGGATWRGAGGRWLPVTNGLCRLSIAELPPGPTYKVRLTCERDPSVTATHAIDFRIGEHVVYYVNDTNAELDAWCTAVGSDDNDGLAPSRPKASVQAVLDQYELEPGDYVRIDTGYYRLDEDIVVDEHDGGAAQAPVVFEASPYGVTLDRGSGLGGHAWEVFADYAFIRTAESDPVPGAARRWMRVLGGGAAGSGIRFRDTEGCRVSRVELAGASTYGIFMQGSRLTIDHCVVRGFLTTGLNNQARDTQISNCTVIVEQGAGILSLLGGQVADTVLYAKGGEARVFNGRPDASDYNVIFTADGAVVSDDCPELGAWREATGLDAHSLNLDPLFVDLDAGDVHVRSTAGAYHEGSWVASADDSPCIDAGYGELDAEPPPNQTQWPAPHRGRRNVGAYGGTELASKTADGRRLFLARPSGGENFLDQNVPVAVGWTLAGGGWSTQDTCNLRYSTNNGHSWISVAAADALQAYDGAFSWRLDGLPAGPLYRLRVGCNQEPSAGGVPSGAFRVGRGLFFYVNDTSSLADAWCTAPGSASNTGTTCASPLLSVRSLLDRYDLEPGDTLRVDTGAYACDADLVVGPLDGGDSSRPVTLEASPNGVTIQRTSQALGTRVVLLTGDYIVLRTAVPTVAASGSRSWMRLAGGRNGVEVEGRGCRLCRLHVTDNVSYGFSLENEDLAVENCIAEGRGVTDCGVWISGRNVSLNRCTVDGADRYGIYTQGAFTRLRHCLVHMDGPGRYAIYGLPYASDYNGFYVTNGAAAAYANGNAYTNMTVWTTATGFDANSIDADPLFADAAAGDYHLVSMTGRYSGGGWLTDAVHSPAIDAGDPLEPCLLEPAGQAYVPILNLGAYGNTEQASRSLDSDGDGASDTLEVLRLGSRADDTDSDDDGASDGDECLADTDPTDPASRLAITNITSANGSVRLQWSSGRRARLFLQTAPSTVSTGAMWETIYIGDPPTMQHEWLVVDPALQGGYYRLKVDW